MVGEVVHLPLVVRCDWAAYAGYVQFSQVERCTRSTPVPTGDLYDLVFLVHLPCESSDTAAALLRLSSLKAGGPASHMLTCSLVSGKQSCAAMQGCSAAPPRGAQA